MPLYRKNEKPRKLRGRHFNYILVEDANTKLQPNVEVILTSYVEGIGRKGETVSMRPNVAYQKLLLPGLAVYASPENIQKYSQMEVHDDEEKHSSQFAQRVNFCYIPLTSKLNDRNFFSLQDCQHAGE